MRQVDRFEFEDVRWRARLRDFHGLHGLGADVRNVGGAIVAAGTRTRSRRENWARSR